MDDPLAPGGKLQKTKMLLTENLPEDIIMEILLRLPVKSLVRFRCVCKSWYLLLTSSDFSTKHLPHSRRQYYLIQVDESLEPIKPGGWSGMVPIYKFALAPEDDLDQLVHIDHPRMGNRQIESLRVIGSIDGLVCVSLNFEAYIMMWNPATRQSYLLPNAGVRKRSMAIGLGRYRNNGYKVVVAYGSSEYNKAAKVCDSYSNMWKRTADPPYLSIVSKACIVANGVPYWWSRCQSLIWFHPIHDTFGTMKLPVELFEPSSIDGNLAVGHIGNDVAGLGVIRGAVAVLVVNFDGYVHDVGAVNVWMMDHRHGDVPIRWTKQFRVDLEVVPEVINWWHTCWKDGELVLDSDTAVGTVGDRELYLYDYLRDETKKVPWIGSRPRAPDEIFLYKESLISPHPRVEP